MTQDLLKEDLLTAHCGIQQKTAAIPENNKIHKMAGSKKHKMRALRRRGDI
jgi:hypothetical protein